MKTTLRIAIIGSRTYNNYNEFKHLLISFINNLPKDTLIEFVSGGAKGADTLAEQFAKEFNMPITVIKPDWEKYGKRAGFVRNYDIINNSNYVIAFWDGKSEGTKHSIEIAKKQGKQTLIYDFIIKNVSSP